MDARIVINKNDRRWFSERVRVMQFVASIKGRRRMLECHIQFSGSPSELALTTTAKTESFSAELAEAIALAREWDKDTGKPAKEVLGGGAK